MAASMAPRPVPRCSAISCQDVLQGAKTRRLASFLRMDGPQHSVLRPVTLRQYSVRSQPVHDNKDGRARTTGIATRTGTFDKARFTSQDIPGLDFWEQRAKSPIFQGTDPQEYYKTAQAYVELAVANKPRWRESLAKPPNSLSYVTLHYIAGAITSGPPAPAWNIAMHILHTISALDYAPSILTTVRLALQAQRLGQPQFHLAESKFAALARREDDANACALQGLILARRLTPEADREAIRWLRRAAALGGEEPGAWEWQASCALEMGSIYLRQGNAERARAIWGFCAKELDIAKGCWLYSGLLDDADPEKYEWVRKAAVNGIREAAQEMARLEGLKMVGTGGTNARGWDLKASKIMQQEWAKLATDTSIA